MIERAEIVLNYYVLYLCTASRPGEGTIHHYPTKHFFVRALLLSLGFLESQLKITFFFLRKQSNWF